MSNDANQDERIDTIFRELKLILENAPKESMLAELEKKARDVDIGSRKSFELALLKLAEKTNRYKLRDVLYEELVSLSSLWNENVPKSNLIDKFKSAYDEEEYKTAGEICLELQEQGLDYHGIIHLGKGKLLPIDVIDNQCVLHYNDNTLHFLDLDFETVSTFDFPEEKKIIDILPPLKGSSKKSDDVDKKIWILIENRNKGKSIIAMDYASKEIEDNEIIVAGEVENAMRISRFQGHLLLVLEKSIFFYNNDDVWQKWFIEVEDITCTQLAKNKFWVGLSDGNVRIFKSLAFSGRRGRFNCHSEGIKSIYSSNLFVAVTSDNQISVTDIEYNPIFKIEMLGSHAIVTTILDNEIVALLQTNGFLVGRDIKRGDVIWKINLKDVYDSMFLLRDRVYCTTTSGEETIIFQIPNFQLMHKDLKEHNIYLTERPTLRNPETPVRNLSEFVGRDSLLESIKSSSYSHFLIYGGAKVGKTSLLLILNEVLASNSVCCYIDMSTLLDSSKSYDSFEENFITKCLSQHAITLDDLEFGTDFQRFIAMIHKLRGSRQFCVFCLDNFSVPSGNSSAWDKNFKKFMTDLFNFPNSRIVLTCGRRGHENIEQYFRVIERKVGGNRRMNLIPLSIFSPTEAKNAIRMLEHFTHSQVVDIYRFTGRFPHLISLYKNWGEEKISIEEYSKQVAEMSNKTIFDYFRELSLDANLFLATIFHRGLISKEIDFNNLYHDIPLLRQLIPQSRVLALLDELNTFCDGIKAARRSDETGFSVNLQQAELFQETAKHIPWFRVFLTLYEFSLNPTWENAYGFILAYRIAAKISLDPGESTESYHHQNDNLYLRTIINQNKDDYYLRQISTEGRKALGMPLVTFIVIPLHPWVREKSINNFNALFNSFQECVRRMQSSEEPVSPKFYILFFDFHDAKIEDIKNEMRGLDRISIIGIQKMAAILLAENPLKTSSEEIFRQLNISERSPYTTSGAVQELFYGREMEIALIRGLPENIGIFGTRTIGKTSLMLKLHRDIKDQPDWNVYALDCSGLESEEDLLKHFAKKMQINFADISNMGEFREYVAQRAETEGSKFLFLLDEVDGLVTYDIQHNKIFQTFNRLCSEPLKSGEPAARFILFGFQQMYEQMNNPMSRLYNFMVFLPLKSLDKQSAFNLVTRPMEEIQIKWQNKSKDANYLIDNCSRYPLLLQAACHALLNILDGKKEDKRDIIEREDIDQVFRQEQFQHLCMRFYAPIIKQSYKPKGLFTKRKKTTKLEQEPFFEDIHRITILAIVRLFFEEKKDVFTLTEVQQELKKYQIKFSPGQMRGLINRLSLNGTLRLIEEPTIISREHLKMQKTVEEKKVLHTEGKLDTLKGFKTAHPDIYNDLKDNFLKFKYEFGVKIFPKILIASLDGIENCKKELISLVNKKQWEKWGRSYS